MKLSIISFGLALVSLSWAVPAPRSDIEPNSKTVQRARVDDAATIGYATQGGATIGGRGGFTIIVSTQAQLIAAVAIKGSKLIIVNDTIAGDAKVVVGSNTTIVGQTGRGKLVNIGLQVLGAQNVIIRNLVIEKVRLKNGAPISVEESNHVWIDHCDLSSERNATDSVYLSLLSASPRSDWISVTYTHFHDSWRGATLGQKPDKKSGKGNNDGHLKITFDRNHWSDLEADTPAIYTGRVHVMNSYFYAIEQGAIAIRPGVLARVEGNKFSLTPKAVYNDDVDNVEVEQDNDYVHGQNPKARGNMAQPDYNYTLVGSHEADKAVVGVAGAKLVF